VLGLRLVLARHGVLAGGDDLPPPAPRRAGGELHHFLWLRAQETGWWEPAVAAGDEVVAGQLLGTIGDPTDPLAPVRQEVRAPEAGYPLFVTSSPAVAADGLLLGLGVG
jgi:predicted deacylase